MVTENQTGAASPALCLRVKSEEKEWAKTVITFFFYQGERADSASSAESLEPLTSHCATPDLLLSTSHGLRSTAESRPARIGGLGPKL